MLFELDDFWTLDVRIHQYDSSTVWRVRGRPCDAFEPTIPNDVVGSFRKGNQILEVAEERLGDCRTLPEAFAKSVC